MIRIGDPIALTVGTPKLGHVRFTPKPQLTEGQTKKLLDRAKQKRG